MVKRPKTKATKPAGGVGDQRVAEIKYPRRTERRKRTKAKILDVAAKQFSEAGYGATTMQNIADVADVHVTTLFMHFKAKSDIALSLAALSIDSFRSRAFDARETVSVFDFVRQEALAVAKALKNRTNSDLGLWSALYRDKDLAFAWSEYDRERKSIIADYVAAVYEFDREVDYRPDIVASLLLTSAFLPHRRWLETSSRGNLVHEIAAALGTGESAARHILEPLPPTAS